MGTRLYSPFTSLLEGQHGSLSAWQAAGLLICLLSVASYLHTFLDWRRRNPQNLPLPPGPPQLPLVGNMFEIEKGRPTWETYADWAQTYGDIFQLKVPGTRILLLSSLDAINDLVERRSNKYSDRVKMAGVEMANADWALGLLPYGPWWRIHRRTFHQLMNQKIVPQYRPIIQHHTRTFLRRLAQEPQKSLDHVQTLFGEIILHMTYGTKDKGEIEYLTRVAEEQVQGITKVLVPGRFLVNIFPVLRFVPAWFPGAGWKRELQHLARLNEDSTLKTFEDAKKRIKEGKEDKAPSLVAQLLDRLPSSEDPEFALKEVIARNVASGVYVAASDTTVGTTWSFILALAMYPEVQKKAQMEIDSVIGPGRLPDFDDISQLPYLQALIKEVVRFWPVAPISLPHATSEDDVYREYFIPRGTMVITNTWAIFRDPKHYPDPYVFNPGRFLKDGQINSDVLDPESCVFGYGRRICPGRFLSRESLGLLTASLVALFNVEPSKDASGSPMPLNYAPKGDVIIKPERFECLVTPRSNLQVLLFEQ